MTAPLVVGLDLSLTATGIAYGDGHGTTTTIGGPATHGDRRLLGIAAHVRKLALGAHLAVIEDLPTHAQAAGITGMVHGAVRLILIQLGVRYALVPPATLKRYATGRGNAGKPEMAVASFKRAGLEFTDDNQCDAWWLRAAGLDYLGHPIVALPADQRAALLRVRWPKRLPHETPLEEQ
jgi:hypothetical protein